jgi:hypothetical protein
MSCVDKKQEKPNIDENGDLIIGLIVEIKL